MPVNAAISSHTFPSRGAGFATAGPCPSAIEAADAPAANVLPIIEKLRASGVTSLAGLAAAALNEV
jgi:hypothetical protein